MAKPARARPAAISPANEGLPPRFHDLREKNLMGPDALRSAMPHIRV
jgi:hypothetical protein